jgi:hypothetical protein
MNSALRKGIMRDYIESKKKMGFIEEVCFILASGILIYLIWQLLFLVLGPFRAISKIL